MFGFGISEIFTLIIVIVLLLNPKDLPKIVRKLGKIYGNIMRQVNQVKKSYHKFEEDLKITEIKDFEDTKYQNHIN
ncbi:MAG: Sec-independent protein translocase subunit TatA/TatB [Pleomorphochaeta sp.]